MLQDSEMKSGSCVAEGLEDTMGHHILSKYSAYIGMLPLAKLEALRIWNLTMHHSIPLFEPEVIYPLLCTMLEPHQKSLQADCIEECTRQAKYFLYLLQQYACRVVIIPTSPIFIT